MTGLIGEHRAKCLFSKAWTVREAAMSKVLLMLRDELQREPGIAASLPGLCTVIRVGVEDKAQQVLFGAVQLIEDVLRAAKRYHFLCLISNSSSQKKPNVLVRSWQEVWWRRFSTRSSRSCWRSRTTEMRACATTPARAWT